MNVLIQCMQILVLFCRAAYTNVEDLLELGGGQARHWIASKALSIVCDILLSRP